VFIKIPLSVTSEGILTYKIIKETMKIKMSGQELKKDLENTLLKEKHLMNKINKKFDLIISDHQKYLSDDHKRYLVFTSVYTLPVERKLEVIIQTEANYIKINGNQTEMFN
jgi:hypothetical protein